MVLIFIYLVCSIILLFTLSFVKSLIKDSVKNAEILQKEKDNLLKMNSQYQSLLKESLPVLRLALKETHPDNNGNPHTFQVLINIIKKSKILVNCN